MKSRISKNTTAGNSGKKALKTINRLPLTSDHATRLLALAGVYDMTPAECLQHLLDEALDNAESFTSMQDDLTLLYRNDKARRRAAISRARAHMDKLLGSQKPPTKAEEIDTEVENLRYRLEVEKAFQEDELDPSTDESARTAGKTAAA
jgi:hypothetical protein